MVSILVSSLSASAATVILTQPQALTVNAGSTAEFTVAAKNSSSELSYQWKYNGNALAGKTNSTLLMENVLTSQAGSYQVQVSSGNDTVESASVKLTVKQGTLVQFTLAGSNVVAELFDDDKPVTVQNFLHYIKANIFVNSFYNYLNPGNVLGAGGYGTADRYATSAFDVTNIYDLFQYSYNYLSGNLPYCLYNEFDTGPHVRNTFGTLAMAKVSGYDVSLSSSWFFNLADNSENLDTNNGGYTVFGRVISGEEVLKYFNTLSEGNGITNLSTLWTNTGTLFEAMPYVVNGTNFPTCADIYYVNVKMLSKFTADTKKPTLTVNYPTVNLLLNNGTLDVTGTVSDKGEIAYVDSYLWYFPVSSNNIASATAMPVVMNSSNWSVSLTNLVVGYYAACMRAWDAYGNLTSLNRYFNVGANISVSTVGNGKVSNNLNGRCLYLGAIPPYGTLKSYTMTAVPNKGSIFAYWSGYYSNVNTPKITLYPTNDLALTAVFVTNYYQGLVGTYNGLFTETNGVSTNSAGFFTLKTTSSGAYSGKLLLGGRGVTLSGKFDYQGNASNTFTFSGTTNAISVNMTLDLTNNTGMITGTVSNQDWVSVLTGYRGATKLSTNTLPAVGHYVLTIPGAPAGYGDDGSVKITAARTGALTIRGKLPDGSAIIESAVVSKEGFWPVYVSYESGNSLLIGWETFDNKTSQGVLSWSKGSSFSVDVLSEAE